MITKVGVLVRHVLFLFFLMMLSLASCQRQSDHPTAPADAIVLRGDVKPVTLRIADMQALSPQTETWTHHGKSRQITGIPLLSLLEKAGWTPGPSGKAIPPKEKHSGHRIVIVATGADGYQAVFSAGELAEQSTKALVVWSIDGTELPPDSGPLRLVVLTDHGMSRSLYQLRTLDLLDISKRMSSQRP